MRGDPATAAATCAEVRMVCRVCHSCCEIDNEDRFAIFIHDGPGDLVVEHTMHSKEQVQRDKRHEVQST